MNMNDTAAEPSETQDWMSEFIVQTTMKMYQGVRDLISENNEIDEEEKQMLNDLFTKIDHKIKLLEMLFGDQHKTVLGHAIINDLKELIPYLSRDQQGYIHLNMEKCASHYQEEAINKLTHYKGVENIEHWQKMIKHSSIVKDMLMFSKRYLEAMLDIMTFENK